MTNESSSKKWDHANSPIAKRKNKLNEKATSGKITLKEKIELNNLNVEFCKDIIRRNKGDTKFIQIMFDEIMKIKNQNKKIENQITLKNKKTIEKPKRKFHLRKGPRK